MDLPLDDEASRSGRDDAEQRLWHHLRGQRFMGMKFKRQVPIGCHTVDFVCHECSLIVEVDGAGPIGRAESARQRDEWLREQGFLVLRFNQSDVAQQADVVLEAIRAAVQRSALNGWAQPLAGKTPFDLPLGFANPTRSAGRLGHP